MKSADYQDVIAPYRGKFRAGVIFGPPGAGKGTIASTLCTHGKMLHCSTGDILRQIPSSSPIKKKLKSYMDRGDFPPDELVLGIWRRYLDGLVSSNQFDPQNQLIVLDGIPRNIHQVEILKQHVDIEWVLSLEIDDVDPIVDRLRKRATIEGRLDDADPDVIKNRFDVYRKQTEPVLAALDPSIIHRVNGLQKPFEVLRDVLQELAPVL